jgi:hypothetical protein
MRREIMLGLWSTLRAWRLVAIRSTASATRRISGRRSRTTISSTVARFASKAPPDP